MSTLWQFPDDVETAYNNPDWLAEAMASEAISTNALLDGIDTLHFQDGIISRDTQVFCEFISIDGEHGFGTIQSWHSNPYDLYGQDTAEDYAFILTAEGSEYSHESNIIPLHETIEVTYEPTSDTLQGVFDTVTAPIDGNSASHYAVLHSVQTSAYGIAVAS